MEVWEHSREAARIKFSLMRSLTINPTREYAANSDALVAVLVLNVVYVVDHEYAVRLGAAVAPNLTDTKRNYFKHRPASRT